MGQDWLLWVLGVSLDLGALLPLCQGEGISHEEHGTAAAELTWTLVGQPLSGNTSHSLATLQEPGTRQNILRRLVSGKSNTMAAGLPWLGDRDAVLPASWCSLLENGTTARCSVPRSHVGPSVGVREAACPAQAEHQGGLGSSKQGGKPVKAAWGRRWTPAWVCSPRGGPG